MTAASSIGSRFQVIDPTCGLVEVATTRKEALEIARHHAEEWREVGNGYGGTIDVNCTMIEVYDHMARYGQPEAWDPEGAALRIRPGR